jgi:hypothetical protein
VTPDRRSNSRVGDDTGRRPNSVRVAAPSPNRLGMERVPKQMGCRSIRCFRSSLDSLFPLVSRHSIRCFRRSSRKDADEEAYRRTWTPRRLARPSPPPSTVKMPAAELTRRSYCVTPATSCAPPVTRRRSPIAAKHGVVDRGSRRRLPPVLEGLNSAAEI